MFFQPCTICRLSCQRIMNFMIPVLVYVSLADRLLSDSQAVRVFYNPRLHQLLGSENGCSKSSTSASASASVQDAYVANTEESVTTTCVRHPFSPNQGQHFCVSLHASIYLTRSIIGIEISNRERRCCASCIVSSQQIKMMMMMMSLTSL